MDIQETIEKRIHPLTTDYFIEEVVLTHSRKTDYWLGRIGSEERAYLAESWETAVEEAQRLIAEKTPITLKDGKDYIPQVRSLIIEYTNTLHRDLSFQNLDEELADPAVKYTAPEGEIIVAVDGDDKVVGMVAYHRHNSSRCEMKRLYVKPEARGHHLGERLVKEIVAHAGNAGYREMVLDTIVPLQSAIGLYKKHGFVECEPYYNNPMDDVIYMRKEL